MNTTLGNPWINRRGHSRIELELPCRRVGTGRNGTAVGRTLNISRTGVLVAWEQPAAEMPNLGEVLTLEIGLPQRANGERALRCRARVVRICSGPGGTPEVAFLVERMVFRANGRPPVRSILSGTLMTEVLATIQ